MGFYLRFGQKSTDEKDKDKIDKRGIDKVVMDKVVSSIHVDGSSDKRRYIIKINGETVKLTPKSFKYFTILALPLKNNNGSKGWVKLEDLEQGYNQTRYIYRMKNEVAENFENYELPLENDKMGSYRLIVDQNCIVTFNEENLKMNFDHDVRRLFDKTNSDKKY